MWEETVLFEKKKKQTMQRCLALSSRSLALLPASGADQGWSAPSGEVAHIWLQQHFLEMPNYIILSKTLFSSANNVLKLLYS